MMFFLASSTTTSREERTHTPLDVVVELNSMFTPADQLIDRVVQQASMSHAQPAWRRAWYDA